MIFRSAEVGHPTSVRVEIREGSYRDMYLHLAHLLMDLGLRLEVVSLATATGRAQQSGSRWVD